MSEHQTQTLPVSEVSHVNKIFRRINSVDFLRGAVMIIMAIDHVRVYSGIPAGGPSPGIFLTRWITHFCAPSFTFLAGVSAYLYFQKTGNKKDVAIFLVTRGLLLVILELTLIRFFWTFNFDYESFTLAGVIWMLGWCMVLLAAFIGMKPKIIGILGLGIIFLQQVFSYVPLIFPSSLQSSIGMVWAFFYPAGSGGNVLSGPSGLENVFGITILYVLIPWIGVMMAGFWFAQVFQKDSKALKTVCIRTGIAAVVVFVLVGTAMILLQPATDDNTPFIFKLLGQQKYPPSQLFLLMTLGPLIALVPFAENVKGWFASAVKTIGKVPMFFYLLHILLIHLSAFAMNLILSGEIHQEWYNAAPLVGIPEESRWGLPLLYCVWVVDVVILYFACRWYAGYKARNPQVVWMKYL